MTESCNCQVSDPGDNNVSNNLWRIGAAINRPPGLPLGMPCSQFYLNGSLDWSFEPLPNWQFADWQRFFLHLPLNMNMASATRNPSANLFKMVKQVENKPGACVLHIGTNGTINTIAQRLNSLKLPASTLPSKCSLLLEPPAGDGNKIGRNWDQLRQLFAQLDPKNNIGLCLDTQHLFGAGMCSFKDAATVLELFEIASAIAPIGCIHLNDSKVPFGANVDLHEAIGAGYIWGQNKESLVKLLELAHERSIDLISETGNFQNDRMVCEQALINRS